LSRLFFKQSKLRGLKKISVLILGLILISSLVPQSAYAATVSFSFPSSPADGNLGVNNLHAQNPQLVADGNSVYIIWREDSDIKFSRSLNNGDNFDSASDIGDRGSASPSRPQIAASGTGVYTVWNDGSDLRYRISTDSGASLLGNPDGSPVAGTITSISSGIPQIAATSSSAFVTWKDNTMILLSSNTQNANSFGGVVTLADPAAASNPRIATSSDDIHVAWNSLN